jgi:hypothetical protein
MPPKSRRAAQAPSLAPPEPGSWPADKVERRSVASLVPHAKNARTHSTAQIKQIAASIREWGWTVPVLIDEGGNIIAGHGRVLAAGVLGLLEVPVVVARGWTEAQKRAYLIADNKLAENAGWNDSLLSLELGELKLGGMDLGLLGFSEPELDRLFAGTGLEGLDEAPAPPADPVTRLGDLWICGAHRVLCGDALVPADYDSLLGGERAAMCFTDPPYNVAYVGKTKRALTIVNDSLGVGFGAFLHSASENILARTGGAIYICMSSSELDSLQLAFRAAGGKWSTFIIWVKNNFAMGRSDYQRQYEPILYGFKDGDSARPDAAAPVDGLEAAARPSDWASGASSPLEQAVYNHEYESIL